MIEKIRLGESQLLQIIIVQGATALIMHERKLSILLLKLILIHIK